ncbi:hypothetical protein V1477_010235 [Vespula maculifrons]|uniref:Uncharacterized protein n=2 Tax=Vespula TaxID=7451 RepID=A0A834NJQ8_VESVU|nr:hypothetical protein HZH66_000843 [Vespula vulgaris]
MPPPAGLEAIIQLVKVSGRVTAHKTNVIMGTNYPETRNTRVLSSAPIPNRMNFFSTVWPASLFHESAWAHTHAHVSRVYRRIPSREGVSQEKLKEAQLTTMQM